MRFGKSIASFRGSDGIVVEGDEKGLAGGVLEIAFIDVVVGLATKLLAFALDVDGTGGGCRGGDDDDDDNDGGGRGGCAAMTAWSMTRRSDKEGVGLQLTTPPRQRAAFLGRSIVRGKKSITPTINKV